MIHQQKFLNKNYAKCLSGTICLFCLHSIFKGVRIEWFHHRASMRILFVINELIVMQMSEQRDVIILCNRLPKNAQRIINDLNGLIKLISLISCTKTLRQAFKMQIICKLLFSRSKKILINKFLIELERNELVKIRIHGNFMQKSQL